MRAIDYAWTRPFERICGLLPAGATIVEVGTINGTTAEERLSQGWSSLAWVAFLQRAGGVLHTIDLSPAHIEICKTVLRDHLPQQVIDDLVRFHVGDGADVLTALVPTLDRIDLLYVDGGTGGAAAARQIEIASPALDRGAGLVAFDDVDSNHPDMHNPECRAYHVFRDPGRYGLEMVAAVDSICILYRRLRR